jgi:hypothetical protein
MTSDRINQQNYSLGVRIYLKFLKFKNSRKLSNLKIKHIFLFFSKELV